MFDIPPELDFTSEHFDPTKALTAKNIYLPYPKAKVYNNLADWYSHTFKKQNNIPSNEGSQKASKNECFVLKRNYEWYYDTLGLDLPDNFDIQKRYQKYTKRKRDYNGKYQVDKKVVVREMPSEMLQPIRSSKILVKRSDGSLREYVFVNSDGTISRAKAKERSINTKDKTTKMKQLSPNVASDSVPKRLDIPSLRNVTPVVTCKPPILIGKKSDIESTNCDSASNISNSKNSSSSLSTVLLNLVNKSPKNDTVVLSATASSSMNEKLGTEFKSDSLQKELISESSQDDNLETSVTSVNKQSDLEFKKQDCVPKHGNTAISSKEISARKTDIKGDNDQSCNKDVSKLCVMSNDIIDRKLEKSERHGNIHKSSRNSDNILKQSAKLVMLKKKVPLNLQESIKGSISLGFIKNKSAQSVKTSRMLNKKSPIALKKNNMKKYSSNHVNTNASFLPKPLPFTEKNCVSNKEKIGSLKDPSSTILKTPKELNKESSVKIQGSREKEVNSLNDCSMSLSHHKVEEKSLTNIKSDIQKEITSSSLQSGSSSSTTLPDYCSLSLKPHKVKEKSTIKGVKSDIQNEISSSKSIQGGSASLSNDCSLSLTVHRVKEKSIIKSVKSDIQNEVSSSKSIQDSSASSILSNDFPLCVESHNVEEKLIIKSVNSDKQNQINSSESIQDSSALLLTSPKVHNKQLDMEFNKLDRNKKVARSVISMTSESVVNQCNILKEKSNLIFTENNIIQREVDCTNFSNDCSPVLRASLKEENKNSSEFNKCDETSKNIKSINHFSCNSNGIEKNEVQNKNLDVEFVKKNGNHEKANLVNDMPSFTIQVNSSDLSLKKYDRNQQEICISESINTNLLHVMPVIVQNDKPRLECDSSELKKHKSANPLKDEKFKVKTCFKNNENESIRNEMGATNLFCETTASVKNVKSHNKKADLHSKESHNPKQRSPTEDCLVTSVSPLKEQNKKVYVGLKKCDSALKEINTKNSLSTPSLKKDKENTKELALLELARSARKRLRVGV